jgi:hypothetical protein
MKQDPRLEPARKAAYRLSAEHDLGAEHSPAFTFGYIEQYLIDALDEAYESGFKAGQEAEYGLHYPPVPATIPAIEEVEA